MTREARVLALQLGDYASLACLRWFFCVEQIFMPSLEHGAEPPMCDTQQACGTCHAALRSFERESSQSRRLDIGRLRLLPCQLFVSAIILRLRRNSL